ncbi:MAG: ACT domain-containing protein [Deferribacteres bacterium]|nr:ACT domain-containing protein [candidate division KSB1 bacterium]MCB9503620.1 ACT domain-containing protein [Deferribacteres bacterium]
MQLKIHPNLFCICRLGAEENMPAWATCGTYFSITRTMEELSIVCEQDAVPPEVVAERNWHLISIAQKLDFSLTGILASIANPLAAAGISIFVVSTFNTDYFLVKSRNFDSACNVLLESRFTFIE